MESFWPTAMTPEVPVIPIISEPVTNSQGEGTLGKGFTLKAKLPAKSTILPNRSITCSACVRKKKRSSIKVVEPCRTTSDPSAKDSPAWPSGLVRIASPGHSMTPLSTGCHWPLPPLCTSIVPAKTSASDAGSGVGSGVGTAVGVIFGAAVVAGVTVVCVGVFAVGAIFSVAVGVGIGGGDLGTSAAATSVRDGVADGSGSASDPHPTNSATAIVIAQVSVLTRR